jgi:hypothetical protein
MIFVSRDVGMRLSLVFLCPGFTATEKRQNLLKLIVLGVCMCIYTHIYIYKIGPYFCICSLLLHVIMNIQGNRQNVKTDKNRQI